MNSPSPLRRIARLIHQRLPMSRRAMEGLYRLLSKRFPAALGWMGIPPAPAPIARTQPDKAALKILANAQKRGEVQIVAAAREQTLALRICELLKQYGYQGHIVDDDAAAIPDRLQILINPHIDAVHGAALVFISATNSTENGTGDKQAQARQWLHADREKNPLAWLGNTLDETDLAVEQGIDEWKIFFLPLQQEVVGNDPAQADAPGWTTFYFGRLLLALGLIDFERFYQASAAGIRLGGDFICLGLPESTARRQSFARDNAFNIIPFPGIKHATGWIGCGLSYKYLLRKARDQKMRRLTVCEDDVAFLPGFEQRYRQIIRFLDQHDDWHVFSGLLTSVSKNMIVHEILETGGENLIKTDKMVGMVLNVYSHRFFHELEEWDIRNADYEKNQIDRFIEQKNHLRILVPEKFLAGHKENLGSTIWNFSNEAYIPLMQTSQKHLQEIIRKHARQPPPSS